MAQSILRSLLFCLGPVTLWALGPLDFPATAAQVSLARLGVADMGAADAFSANPALLGTCAGFDFSASGHSGMMQSGLASLSAVMPFGLLRVGVQFTTLQSAVIAAINEWGVASGDTLNGSENSLVIGAGVPFLRTDTLALSFGAQAALSLFGATTNRAFGLGFGGHLKAALGKQHLSVGVSLLNVLQAFEPGAPGFSVLAGADLRIPVVKNLALTPGVEFGLGAAGAKLSASLAATGFDLVTLRGGWAPLSEIGPSGNWSAGLGLRLREWSLDYALGSSPVSQEWLHSFTLRGSLPLPKGRHTGPTRIALFGKQSVVLLAASAKVGVVVEEVSLEDQPPSFDWPHLTALNATEKILAPGKQTRVSLQLEKPLAAGMDLQVAVAQGQGALRRGDAPGVFLFTAPEEPGETILTAQVVRSNQELARQVLVIQTRVPPPEIKEFRADAVRMPKITSTPLRVELVEPERAGQCLFSYEVASGGGKLSGPDAAVGKIYTAPPWPGKVLIQVRVTDPRSESTTTRMLSIEVEP